jgi:GNAT superfamily N-acetyltransferase
MLPQPISVIYVQSMVRSSFLMQLSFAIRRAMPSDIHGILACLHTAFAPYQNSYIPAAYADTVLTPDTLRLRLQSMSIFVAVSAVGEIVGTIACNAVSRDEGHLRGMAVLPGWHGMGVAGALLKCAESELLSHGCKQATLDTTAPLLRATRFYAKNGYCATGTVRDFFGMPLYEYAKRL